MRNKNIEDIENGGYKISSFRLFGFLPFFSKWENDLHTYYKIFGIPFLHIKKTCNKEVYKLFSILPLKI